VGAIRRHPIFSSVVAVLAVVLAVSGLTAFAVWQAAHTDDASLI
jgi:hypothetical protein